MRWGSEPLSRVGWDTGLQVHDAGEADARGVVALLHIGEDHQRGHGVSLGVLRHHAHAQRHVLAALKVVGPRPVIRLDGDLEALVKAIVLDAREVIEAAFAGFQRVGADHLQHLETHVRRVEVAIHALTAHHERHGHVARHVMAIHLTRRNGALQVDVGNLAIEAAHGSGLDGRIVSGSYASFNRLERLGTRKKVALCAAAAHALQELQLLGRLHTLNERLEVELLGKVDDIGQKHARVVARLKAAQEAHVNLDEVKRVLLQKVERGVPAAEVVHPHLKAVRAEAVDLVLEELLVAGEGALGNLHGHVLARNTILVEDRLNLAHHVAQLEVEARQVDGDRGKLPMRVHPATHIAACTANNLQVKLMDEARLFKHRNELVGVDGATLWVFPAREGLLVTDLARRHVHDGLVVHLDVALLNGLVKVVEHVLAGGDLPLELLVVLAEVHVLAALDGVACQLGAVADDARLFHGAIWRADASLQPDGGVLEVLAKLLAHLLDARQCGRARGSNHELVGAPTRGDASGVCVLNGAANQHQQLITRGVTKLLVVALEVLHVEVDHCERVVFVVGVGVEHDGQLVAEVHAVCQARELVLFIRLVRARMQVARAHERVSLERSTHRTVFALTLGLVHLAVGKPDGLVKVIGLLELAIDVTKATGEVERRAVIVNGGDAVAQCLKLLQQVIFALKLTDDDKLVAAIAEGVLVAKLTLHRLTNLLKQQIAHVLAVGIVNQAEVVHIRKNHVQRLADQLLYLYDLIKSTNGISSFIVIFFDNIFNESIIFVFIFLLIFEFFPFNFLIFSKKISKFSFIEFSLFIF